MQNIIYKLNVPRSLRRASWMRDNDFIPWFNLLVWATGTKEDKPMLKILLMRIKHMYTTQGGRKNLRFVFTYLKECYTMVISAKVGTAYTPKLGVKVGKSTGLPLIIPGGLRKRLLSDRRLYIAVSTLLGIHRIVPWWPQVDLSTIIGNFDGLYNSLDVAVLKTAKGRLCELAGLKDDSIEFTRLKSRALFPESSGPNKIHASYGVVEDTIALVQLRNWSYTLTLVKWFYYTRSYLMLVSFVLSLFCASFVLLVARILNRVYRWVSLLIRVILFNTFMILSVWCVILWRITGHWIGYLLTSLRENWYEYDRMYPYWFWASEGKYDFIQVKFIWFFIKFLTWFGTRTSELEVLLVVLAEACEGFYLKREHVGERYVGRLAAVYNTAGKARVVGITNYWTQCALYPLHKNIFQFLERLPTDGTYDQLKPVKALVEGPKYFSYDLTAATDRLPRKIQEDVLSLFIGSHLSSLWNRLVDMEFSFGSDLIKYQVGQPMGAYSSWAMLALTHHMIVQSSSDQCIKEYAVLGDDVIVPEYATKYLSIMEGLGVGISLAKSIVSNEFIEFAKRVRTLKGEDYSILGPGLIMTGVRNRWFSGMIVADSYRKDLLGYTKAPQVFETMPGISKNPDMLKFGSWVLFGPKGLISKTLSFRVKQGTLTNIQDLKQMSMWDKGDIKSFLRKEVTDRWNRSVSHASRVLNSFKGIIWEYTAYSCSIGPKSQDRMDYGLILHILVYVTFWVTPVPWFVISNFGRVLESVNPWLDKQYDTKWYIDDIINDALDGFPELELSSLDPLTYREAADIRLFYNRLCKHQMSAPTKQSAAPQPAYLRVHGDVFLHVPTQRLVRLKLNQGS